MTSATIDLIRQACIADTLEQFGVRVSECDCTADDCCAVARNRAASLVARISAAIASDNLVPVD